MLRNLLLLLSSAGDASVEHYRKTRQFWDVHLLCITSRWHTDKHHRKNDCGLFLPFTIHLYQAWGAGDVSFLPCPSSITIWKFSHNLVWKNCQKGSGGRNQNISVSSILIMYKWTAQKSLPIHAEIPNRQKSQRHWKDSTFCLCAGAHVPGTMSPNLSSSNMLELLCHRGSFRPQPTSWICNPTRAHCRLTPPCCAATGISELLQEIPRPLQCRPVFWEV